MVELRAAFGLVTSVLLHGALIAWSLFRAVGEPEPSIDELVAIQLLDTIPLEDVQPSRDSGPATPASPSADPPDPDSAKKPRPTARRSKPSHEPAVVVGVAPRDSEVQTLGEPTPVQSEPEASEDPVTPSHGGVDGHATSGQGDGNASHGTFDHTTYGAEIVRIIQTAIDEDPVPGIGVFDSVHVLLTILPDGRLEAAVVLASSLSVRKTRQILRRIEQASTRFPGHPRGFRRGKYVVDVTLRFR